MFVVRSPVWYVNCDPGGAGVLRPASRARTEQFSVYVGCAQPKRVPGAVRVFSLPPRSVCKVVCRFRLVDSVNIACLCFV
jgi:hypothetical protein